MMIYKNCNLLEKVYSFISLSFRQFTFVRNKKHVFLRQAGNGKEGEKLFCAGNPKNLTTFKGSTK